MSFHAYMYYLNLGTYTCLHTNLDLHCINLLIYIVWWFCGSVVSDLVLLSIFQGLCKQL